jgi:hypothetical protein
MVVIEGPIIVIERSLVIVPPTLSVTRKVTVSGPTAPVGVPEITPVEELRDSPAGRLADVTDQV